MKPFRLRSNKKRISYLDENPPMNVYAPRTFSAACLGELCPNFKGEACKSSFFEWIGASATVVEGRDTDKPPRQDEAIYVTYGQVCISGFRLNGIRYRIHDYGKLPFNNNQTGLVVHGDSVYGDGIDVDYINLTVNNDGSTSEQHIKTYEGWGPGGLKELL